MFESFLMCCCCLSWISICVCFVFSSFLSLFRLVFLVCCRIHFGTFCNIFKLLFDFTCEICDINEYSTNSTIDFVNTSEMAPHVVDQHPLLQVVYGILGPVLNGLLSSSAHSNTSKRKKEFIWSKDPLNIKDNFIITCKHVTFAQKNGANLPPHRDPWHSSHIWSSKTYGFTSTRLSMSPCCNWTNRADIAAM